MICHSPASFWEATAAASQTSKPHCLTAAQHGALLHGRFPGEATGHVAVATNGSGERWREKVYAVCELPEVLPYYAGRSDVFLSIQRFWGWRRIAQLAQCGALVVDVDFYKKEKLAGSHPLGILEDCRIALEAARKPQPSLAIASGRGLNLLWFHEPIPRGALPRWNACQKELWKVLRPQGADRSALDAARVLRLVGSQHSGVGVSVEALTPTGDVWEFDSLADEVLPLTRAEVMDLRIRRAARDARKSAKRSAKAAHAFGVATLWEARLRDLQALVNRVRWSGELPEGQRDIWMFLACNAMSWLAVPEVLEREAHALACEVTPWHDRESKTRMHAIFKRALMAARGETIEWRGLEIDPRYRFKTETIIELLDITPEEQKEMDVLISPAEKYRRKVEKRRKAGVMPRAEYEGRAMWRRSEARRLVAEGKTFKEIGKLLGVKWRSVYRLISE
jgi:hypothetical protein